MDIKNGIITINTKEEQVKEIERVYVSEEPKWQSTQEHYSQNVYQSVESMGCNKKKQQQHGFDLTRNQHKNNINDDHMFRRVLFVGI